MQPLVIAVILNTNRREDTLDALDSLQRNDYPNHRDIVLDNGSRDGSVESIQSVFPRTQIIELKKNLGYAGNNNIGIQAALEQGADWVLVLNEDTILAPDCLSRLVNTSEADGFRTAGETISLSRDPRSVSQSTSSRGPSAS